MWGEWHTVTVTVTVSMTAPSNKKQKKVGMKYLAKILRESSLILCCQEIGLVAFMFFFELLFPYVSLTISFYVSLTNLFSIILFLIC